MNRNYYRTLLIAATCVASLHCLGESVPSQIDLRKFPATQLDEVVVPLPSEVFNVLDKLGAPNWRGELRDPVVGTRGERAQIALLLGSIVAEGFVAVEAADKERVKEVGRGVLELARAIGVEKTVLSRTNLIVTKADSGDWGAVRRELDGALTDVKNAMIELRDSQLAHLVSLGGWIRGTEVLTSVVEKQYSDDGADLLNQPDLLTYFQKRIADLPMRMRNNQLVSKIERGLNEISPLINQKITPGSVKRINEITGQLVKAIDSHA